MLTQREHELFFQSGQTEKITHPIFGKWWEKKEKKKRLKIDEHTSGFCFVSSNSGSIISPIPSHWRFFQPTWDSQRLSSNLWNSGKSEKVVQKMEKKTKKKGKKEKKKPSMTAEFNHIFQMTPSEPLQWLLVFWNCIKIPKPHTHSGILIPDGKLSHIACFVCFLFVSSFWFSVAQPPCQQPHALLIMRVLSCLSHLSDR